MPEQFLNTYFFGFEQYECINNSNQLYKIEMENSLYPIQKELNQRKSK